MFLVFWKLLECGVLECGGWRRVWSVGVEQNRVDQACHQITPKATTQNTRKSSLNNHTKKKSTSNQAQSSNTSPIQLDTTSPKRQHKGNTKQHICTTQKNAKSSLYENQLELVKFDGRESRMEVRLHAHAHYLAYSLSSSLSLCLSLSLSISLYLSLSLSPSLNTASTPTNRTIQS